jgi:hypothetical protein
LWGDQGGYLLDHGEIPIQVIISVYLARGIGVEFLSVELWKYFSVANVYGYYEDKLPFWEEDFEQAFM